LGPLRGPAKPGPTRGAPEGVFGPKARDRPKGPKTGRKGPLLGALFGLLLEPRRADQEGPENPSQGNTQEPGPAWDPKRAQIDPKDPIWGPLGPFSAGGPNPSGETPNPGPAPGPIFGPKGDRGLGGPEGPEGQGPEPRAHPRTSQTRPGQGRSPVEARAHMPAARMTQTGGGGGRPRAQARAPDPGQSPRQGGKPPRHPPEGGVGSQSKEARAQSYIKTCKKP